MSYESLFATLGMVVVASPLFLTIVLGLTSLTDWQLPEESVSRLVFVTTISGLLAATLVLFLMLATGARHVAIDVGEWVAIPQLYQFSIKFVFDRLSVPFAILSFVLSGTIGPSPANTCTGSVVSIDFSCSIRSSYWAWS